MSVCVSCSIKHRHFAVKISVWKEQDVFDGGGLLVWEAGNH